jgi:hypothetical protein
MGKRCYLYLQIIGGSNAETRIIQPRALILNSPEELLHDWVMDHSNNNLLLDSESNGDTTKRKPSEKKIKN